MQTIVYFNHGKESGPWGSKITGLSEVARRRGLAVASVDYQGMDDQEARVAKLLAVCQDDRRPKILVGSSMGSYVAAVASATLQPLGLFLMAPAFYIPGWQHPEPAPHARRTVLIHGWHDEVIPVENSIRYARQFSAQLHLVDSDHRLENQLSFLELLFGILLEQLLTGDE